MLKSTTAVFAILVLLGSTLMPDDADARRGGGGRGGGGFHAAAEAALTLRAAADALILPEGVDAIMAAVALPDARIQAIRSRGVPEADQLPDARDVRPIQLRDAQDALAIR
ncbi:hypothetical protein [Bradyrhizobium sp. CCGE-LA001]|uniref:hypothetical protein n=1 Tax=Bradyrhizobium sp. CCGE-LA001 TaxID=1223566 RepID=UPI0002AA8122|nr:hypothetical protein [Bradyrhizobium sp. CCGE-LA001]